MTISNWVKLITINCSNAITRKHKEDICYLLAGKSLKRKTAFFNLFVFNTEDIVCVVLCGKGNLTRQNLAKSMLINYVVS